MIRCNKCIFPDTLPGISFNMQGICNFCQNYEKIKYQGEHELYNLVKSLKNLNKRYDCIIPLSGGRDSSYVLYYAKKKLKLKDIIAINYNNEFRNEQALINMKNACEILNVDLISFKSKSNIASKIVLKRIKSSLDIPFNNSIKILSGSFCVACTYGYKAVVYQIANRYDIPLIIWGNSKIEKTTHITSNYLHGNYFDKLTTVLFLLNCEFDRLKQRMEFPFCDSYFQNCFSHRPKILNKSTREISLFDYVQWNREKIKETIQKELKWKKPENWVSTWRIDCKLEILINYIFFHIFGCSKSCFGFHNMINENQMRREEALILEEKIKNTSENNIQEILINIGLTKKEINKFYKKLSSNSRLEK